MSRHFTYEINERNLRLQLKDLEAPCNDEAWQKFNTYTNGQKSKHKENRFSKVNVSLSRNVLIPAVFVAIILIFSFLLFNFITINNHAKEDAKEPIAKRSIESSKRAPNNSQSNQQNSVSVLSSAVSSNTLITTQPSTLAATQKEVVVNTPAENGDTNLQKQIAQNPNTSDSTKQVNAKKHHKNHRVESLDTEQLRDLRPTLVADDQETDVRPN